MDSEQTVTELETRLEEAGETTDELDNRVAAAGLESALGECVAAARRNLQRTRVKTRRELARSLVDEATSRHLEADPDYLGYSRYDRAREQLSTARAVAAKHDLEADAVEDTLDRVETRLDRLVRQPVGLAKQATERALGTDDPAVGVETTRAALEHHQDALTVAWGADREGPYDREELQYRVALLADGLVDARRAYAARLEASGDALAAEGDHERARERYGRLLHSSTPPSTPQASSAHPILTLSSVSGPVSNRRWPRRPPPEQPPERFGSSTGPTAVVRKKQAECEGSYGTRRSP